MNTLLGVPLEQITVVWLALPGRWEYRSQGDVIQHDPGLSLSVDSETLTVSDDAIQFASSGQRWAVPLHAIVRVGYDVS